MQDKKAILFIKPSDSSFILSDQSILNKEYNVVPYKVLQKSNKIVFALSLLKLSLFIIFKQHKKVAFISWFADYHAAVMVFFARLFGKISIIFAGGQEAVCYKELGKGVYLKRVRSFLVKYALRNCTLIIPNHESLNYHKNHFYNPVNPHIDGIIHYVGKLNGKIVVVPNGIDQNHFSRNPEIEKVTNLVVTLGTMNNKADFINKGFDLFIETAKLLPENSFVMIGLNPKYESWLEENYSVSQISNLKVINGFCPHEILHEYFNRAHIYVQVSITEGMPFSLGEAMLCECIPIGSSVNGIPDLIGDTGVIIYERNPEKLKNAIIKASSLDTGQKARERIINHYSKELRETKLLKLLSDHF